MRLVTTEINPGTHPHLFANSWLEAKSILDTGEPFICIPTTTNNIISEQLDKAVSNLPRDLCQGSESAYGHMYEQRNIMGDSKHLWNWRNDRDTKIKQLKEMFKKNTPQNINSLNGMVNCYGTKIHSIIGLSIAKGIEECYPNNMTKLGNNRMRLSLSRPWSSSVNISAASYHIEGMKTGLTMEDIRDSIYFGIIVPLPTHKRGFCSFKYKTGITHSNFIEALINDRKKGITCVSAPRYFTCLKEAFWSTRAGSLIEPLSVVIPEDYTILFNQFLPHGISNAVPNISIYIDVFIGEEAAKSRHNKWHSIQHKWDTASEGYDINAFPRTQHGTNKYPTLGYYDMETYKYNWDVHKIWCWCMKAAPSHWPSGKETFAVHTSGYGTAKKKGLLEQYHVFNNANLVRFHYRKERPFVIDEACRKRCISKGFTLPSILLGESVVRDPSILDKEFAIKFGFDIPQTQQKYKIKRKFNTI